MDTCKNSKKNFEKQKFFPFSNFLEPTRHNGISAKNQLFDPVFSSNWVEIVPGTRLESCEKVLRRLLIAVPDNPEPQIHPVRL